MAFLNINKAQNKNIVKKIDQDNYMKLGKPTSRLDLYNFALALGVRSGGVDSETPLQNKESLVRDEYIGNDRFLYSALFFSEKEVTTHPELIDTVIEDSVTFQIADKYAEAGFKILEDNMKSIREMPFCYKLLEEMDIIFKKIENELPKEHIGIEYDEAKMVADESTL